jgi:hypothetical protein
MRNVKMDLRGELATVARWTRAPRESTITRAVARR